MQDLAAKADIRRLEGLIERQTYRQASNLAFGVLVMLLAVILALAAII